MGLYFILCNGIIIFMKFPSTNKYYGLFFLHVITFRVYILEITVYFNHKLLFNPRIVEFFIATLLFTLGLFNADLLSAENVK